MVKGRGKACAHELERDVFPIAIFTTPYGRRLAPAYNDLSLSHARGARSLCQSVNPPPIVCGVRGVGPSERLLKQRHFLE